MFESVGYIGHCITLFIATNTYSMFLSALRKLLDVTSLCIYTKTRNFKNNITPTMHCTSAIALDFIILILFNVFPLLKLNIKW